MEADIAFPKTHNLLHLLTLLLPIEPAFETLKPDLPGLKAFGVSIVYSGKKADKADAANALRFCRTVRKTVRMSLGLPL